MVRQHNLFNFNITLRLWKLHEAYRDVLANALILLFPPPLHPLVTHREKKSSLQPVGGEKPDLVNVRGFRE